MQRLDQLAIDQDHSLALRERRGMRRRDAAGPGDLLGRWAENPVRHGQRLRVDQRLTVEAERSPLSAGCGEARLVAERSEEHTSELPSLMRNSYAVFCLKK